jgi:hypothetical protein
MARRSSSISGVRVTAALPTTTFIVCCTRMRPSSTA